jgi:anti-anti-sigma factor
MSTTLSPVTALAQLHLHTSYPSPSTARVTVIGEIDMATASALSDRLLDVLQEQTPAVLDVDLAGVTFLDCTGISAIVAVRKAAVRAGRGMRISNPQPVVRRVLDVTGLLGVFTAPFTKLNPVGSGHPCGVGLTPMTATQPSSVLAA